MTNFLAETISESPVISYSGTFDKAILSAFAQKVENDFGNNPVINKKIFKIFIELAQNIALYSSDRVIKENKTNFNGYGIFIIKEYFDKFKLFTGNMALKQDAVVAVKKCEKINSLSRDELRKYKRLLRKKPSRQKGGGNIGLVQVVLTANNYLEYKTIKVDNENSFLILSIDIDKFNS